MHLVCPACASTNRVPAERMLDNPTCGRCGHALAPAKPMALQDSTLPKYLQKTEAPVLVDFWAEWCGPCKMYGPQFEKAAAVRRDVRFVKIDSDSAPQASAAYSVRSIPTTILFRQGVEVGRLSGAVSAEQLNRWLDQQLQ